MRNEYCVGYQVLSGGSRLGDGRRLWQDDLAEHYQRSSDSMSKIVIGFIVFTVITVVVMVAALAIAADDPLDKDDD